LLADIVEDTETDHLVTLTGKAASVLRVKGRKQAQTCHSLIYNLRNKKLKDDGTVAALGSSLLMLYGGSSQTR
jgi:hypothetical protein